jgi:hypothetical protein
MPIHKQGSGWQWGNHGKIYRSRKGAEAQARAAYANGYRGDDKRNFVEHEDPSPEPAAVPPSYMQSKK